MSVGYFFVATNTLSMHINQQTMNESR